MIKVLFADNSPIMRHGVMSYFEDNTKMKFETFTDNLEGIERALAKNKYDIVVFDVELNGMTSFIDVKTLVKSNSDVKFIILTNVSDMLYGPPAYKIGVKGYFSKNIELEDLKKAIINIFNDELMFSDEVIGHLDMLKKTKKEDRLFKKLSNREVEVLRYFKDGKKNKEVAKLLNLDEKTISTYKLRLLQKLNVTNLVDLLNKAKELGII